MTDEDTYSIEYDEDGDPVSITFEGVTTLAGSYGHGFYSFKEDHECGKTACVYWEARSGVMRVRWSEDVRGG